MLATLTAALTPLTTQATVELYLKQQEEAKKAVQEAAKTTASANLTDLATLVTMAQETVTRVDATKAFYDGLVATATASKATADGLVTKNAADIAAATKKVTDGEAAVTKAVADCKVAGYTLAQEAWKAL